MPTFQKCPKEIADLSADIIEEFETHQPLADAHVTIDFVFAYSDKDEKTGASINNALSKNGMRALGVCRKIPLKDRALGRGDAEIAIDGDWWSEANSQEQRALLDHEMHHIEVRKDDRGFITDDLRRPVLRLRKHDVEVGWFKIVASRHGIFSQERMQAKAIMADCGQLFWPDIVQGHTDATEHAVRNVRRQTVPA